jgi:hypothetical protein
MPEIYAEKVREDVGSGYYNWRYIVYNGDMIGTYGVFYRPDGDTFGASRDYHQVATPAEVEAYENRTEDDYVRSVQACEYHDDKPCICDGSGLVERTTDDKRAFEIAAMMAEVVGSPKA